MTRPIDLEVKADLKLVHITVKRLAETPILDGQVVSIGTYSGTVIPCTDMTVPFGVACNGVTAEAIAEYEAEKRGEDTIEVVVCISGICPVLAGEELDPNEWVQVDSDGRVIPAVGGEIIGFNLSPTAGDGNETSIFIHRVPYGRGGI